MAESENARVVGRVNSVQALVRWLHTQPADLAVIEVSTLGVIESEAILQMLEGLPLGETLAVLLLVEDIDLSARERVLHLVEADVSVAAVSVSAHQLRCAVEAIASGFTLLHPDATEMIFTGGDVPFSSIDSPLTIEPLTPREVEVLNRVADGLANRAIAKALNISEHTVKFHISAIFSKLDVASRTEAVRVGIRNGLVRL